MPRAANVITPSSPAEREIGHLSNRLVPLVAAPETDDKEVPWLICCAAENLPISVVGVAYTQDWIVIAKHTYCRDDRSIRRVCEWPIGLRKAVRMWLNCLHDAELLSPPIR